MKPTFDHRNRSFALAFACLAALAALGARPSSAAEQASGMPGDWLSQYLGPRPAGIGGAFVALADDPIGAVWNPAGLSFISQNQMSAETSRLFEGTSINALSIAVPGRKLPSFGLTILNLRSGEFEKTNELNEPLGEFSESNMAFLLSISKNVTPRLAIGVNAKVVRHSLDEFDAAGVGADIGAMYQILPSLRVGASVLNIGGPTINMRSLDETYPAEFRGGLSLFFLGGRGLISAELDHRKGPGTSFFGGTEFWVHRVAALRLGYAGSEPSGGLSVYVSPDFRLDYAAVDHELGVVHSVALSYRFGGFFASSRAVPEVFSPLGQQSVTKFQLAAKTKTNAQSWSLDIVDKSNQVVRRFGGKGLPPAHVMWDGKDETGLPLPDGVYTYQLVVMDGEGARLEGHPRSVEITTEGPRGVVPVVTEMTDQS